MKPIESWIDSPVKLNNRGKALLTTGFLAWLVLTLVYVAWNVRSLTADSVLGKQLGIGLALKGTFFGETSAESVFAILQLTLSPLYPLLFGLWTVIWGVGSKQANAFDFLIRGAAVLCLVVIVWPWLKPRLNVGDAKAKITLTIFFLLCFIPSQHYPARELAMVFGLWACHAYDRLRHQGSGCPPIGLLGGFSLLSNFPVGIFFVCVLTIRAFLVKEKKVAIVFMVAVAFVIELCGLVPILVSQDGMASTVGWGSLVGTLISSEFGLSADPFFSRFVNHGETVFLVVFLLGLFIYFQFGDHKRPLHHPLRLPLLCSLIPFFLQFLLGREASPVMWFPYLLAAGSVLCAWLQQDSKGQVRAVGALLILAFIPSLCLTGPAVFRKVGVPVTKSTRFICEKVISMVEPEATLAVPADDYLEFRAFRAVNVFPAACPWSPGFDYVYLGNQSPRQKINQSCEKRQECFSSVFDFRETEAGHRDLGGILFKRTGDCKSPTYVSQF